MLVHDIIAALPESESVLAQYGLTCFNCSASDKETLQDGCRSHGMSEADIDDLVQDLNDMSRQKAGRPKTIGLTEAAAKALLDVLSKQEKEGWGLVVTSDGGASFSLEAAQNPPPELAMFFHPVVPGVRLYASGATLDAIGGSVIDHRDGRFKLDLPSPQQAKTPCACAGGGVCACKATREVDQ